MSLRWRIKKIARLSVAWGSWYSGYCSLIQRKLGNSVRVLTYHRFGDTISDPFCVSESDFEAFSRRLTESGKSSLLADVEIAENGVVKAVISARLVAMKSPS